MRRHIGALAKGGLLVGIMGFAAVMPSAGEAIASLPITGTVVDPDLKPVSGATVSWRENGEGGIGPVRSGETTTDSRGEYSLVVPPDIGPLEIEAAKPFFMRLSLYWRGDGARIDFLLPRAAAIHGGVFDFATGKPLAGFEVGVTGAEEGPFRNGFIFHGRRFWPGTGTWSDSLGQYRLENIAPGHHIMSAESSTGMQLQAREFEIRAGEDVEIDFSVYPTVDVTGRVTDAQTGQPIAGAEIKVYVERGIVGRSDASGSFRCEGVRSSNFEDELVDLTCRGPGHVPEIRGLVFRPGESPAPVDFALRRGGTVTGVVRDEETGQGVAGKSVVAWVTLPEDDALSVVDGHFTHDDGDLNPGTTTDESGKFELSGIWPGRPFTVTVSDPDKSGEWSSDSLALVDGQTLDLRPISGEPQRVEHRFVIRGRVVDKDGKPFDDATVVATLSGSTGKATLEAGARTNRLGDFEIVAVLPDGDASSSAVADVSARSRDGQIGPSVSVEARVDAPFEGVDLRLDAGYPLEVRIEPPPEEALPASLPVSVLPHVSVDLRREARSRGSSELEFAEALDDIEHSLFRHIPAGRYTLDVKPGTDARYEPQQIDVEIPRDKMIIVSLKRSAPRSWEKDEDTPREKPVSVRMHVVEAVTGRRILAAQGGFLEDDGSVETVWLEPAGKPDDGYVVRIPPGQSRFVAYGPNHAPLREPISLDVPAGAAVAPIIVALEPGITLTGTITLPDGSPAAWSRIEIAEAEGSAVRVSRRVRLDADGRFTVHGLAETDYEIAGEYHAWHSERSYVLEMRVRVSPGGGPVSFAMQKKPRDK